jgi:hypothetical protein
MHRSRLILLGGFEVDDMDRFNERVMVRLEMLARRMSDCGHLHEAEFWFGVMRRLDI